MIPKSPCGQHRHVNNINPQPLLHMAGVGTVAALQYHVFMRGYGAKALDFPRHAQAGWFRASVDDE